MTRFTPADITALQPGELFVFGSNSRGAHAGGAARIAVEKFGAIWGCPMGMQGQSYAIDTMSGLEVLKKQVAHLLNFAAQRPNLTFLVTEIGCGIAGYTPAQVAPFFEGAPKNVVLPESFHSVLNPAGA